MTERAKISLKKIETLKKRLQKLPLKDEMKSREEAVKILEVPFQNALKKGYSLKELRTLFVEEGVALPLSLLKKRTAGEQEHSARIVPEKAETKTEWKEPESPVGFTIKPDTQDEQL